MRETRVWSLCCEDPLEKEMAIHSRTIAWKSHGQRSLVGYSPWGRKESDTTEQLHFHFQDTARSAHRTKDWAELAGCGPAHPPPETGRWGQPELEGGNPGPREASYTKLQADIIANQDFLGFWIVNIRQKSCRQRSVPQKRHTAHLRRHARCTPRKPSGWDGGGDKSQPSTGGNCAHQAPGHLSCSDLEEHKTQAQPNLRLCGVPESLNGLDLGTAWNPGPASDSSRQSNLESEQCRLGKYMHREQGQTQCGWITVSTRQWYLFAMFLPPHSTTEQVSLKKVTSTTPLVSGWKLDTEETSKQKKLK